MAVDDPGALAPLLRTDAGPGWTLARSRLGGLLGVAADHPLVRLAAGWLVGQLFDPADAQEQAATATVLARAAGAVRSPETAAQAQPGPGPG